MRLRFGPLAVVFRPLARALSRHLASTLYGWAYPAVTDPGATVELADPTIEDPHGTYVIRGLSQNSTMVRVEWSPFSSESPWTWAKKAGGTPPPGEPRVLHFDDRAALLALVAEEIDQVHLRSRMRREDVASLPPLTGRMRCVREQKLS